MYSILQKIILAKTENEITALIEQYPDIFNQKNWKPIGAQENNFGTIEAQGKYSERAMVEKITNSIDAVLLREARARGIDPDSEDAPKSIPQALEMFFDIEMGDLSTLSRSKKDELASQIYVIAENFAKHKGNFYIIDQGEGQSPENFEKTFLKFGGNKANTQFVHGRFGTGSFGVLPNAGENKYQLILSKSYQESKNPGSSWGWTLVRKNRNRKLATKHAWYEFLVNSQQTIHKFEKGDLVDLIRSSIEFDKLDIKSYVHGTVIKLFNYDLVTSSDIDRDFSRLLNRYLYSPALPFRILDSKTTSNVGSGKEIDGNENRLRKNTAELEGGGKIQIQKVQLPKLGVVNIDIYVSKRRPGKLSFIQSEQLSNNDEAVFFLRNGQSHGELPRSFIRDKLGLEYIARDTVIYIDCTDTDTLDFDEVFSPTRDSMRKNYHRMEVEDALKRELKDSEVLKTLNAARRSNVIEETIKKQKNFVEYINDLYTSDPALRKMLVGTLNITDRANREGANDQPFEGVDTPTYLEIIDKEVRSSGNKSLPVNSFVRVALKTDAKNDYLYREHDPGKLIVDFDGVAGSYKLFDGILSLKFAPPHNNIEPGKLSAVKISLTRPYGDPLIAEFNISYTKKIEKISKPKGEPKKRTTNQLHLPKPNICSKKQWQDIGNDENDLCELAVIEAENNSYQLTEVNINSEFPYFMNYLRNQHLSNDKVEMMKNQYAQAVYIAAIVTHSDFSKDNTYRRDTVREVMNQIGRSIPFILFTMQKKWQEEFHAS